MVKTLEDLIEKLRADNMRTSSWIESNYRDYIKYRDRWFQDLCQFYWEDEMKVAEARITGYLGCLGEEEYLFYEELKAIFSSSLKLQFPEETEAAC